MVFFLVIKPYISKTCFKRTCKIHSFTGSEYVPNPWTSIFSLYYIIFITSNCCVVGDHVTGSHTKTSYKKIIAEYCCTTATNDEGGSLVYFCCGKHRSTKATYKGEILITLAKSCDC